MPDLPNRPWARSDVPLVWRSDTCVEMGWPPGPIRVEDIDRPHVTWLLSLRGERTLTEAVEAGAHAGLSPRTMRRLARAGVRTGLLDDASTVHESLRGAPLRVREELSANLSLARQVHGSSGRAVFDKRLTAEVAVRGDNLLADTVAMVLSASGVGDVTRTASRTSGSRRQRRSSARRACEVLCDALHPDAASHPDAMALDIPHLAATVVGPRAVVGPLVIPGRSSCLRCRDLHLTDADSTWPRAAVQWSARKPVGMSPGLAHLAGAWAALQVLALIDAGARDVSTPALDGALVITLPDTRPDHEARPPHPLCGCRWPRTGRGISA